MEDVLDVYERPYDPLYPVFCMDEKPYQLLGEGREPLPQKPGSDKKLDSEYVRNGTCSIFAMVEPLAGWHRVRVREHRTATDWAEEIKDMVDSRPEAKKIILIMDNLNTHTVASLYQTFEPKHALELASRLEIHFTPKHGSWLDIAEIELSALGRQCIGSRRIPDLETLNSLLEPWYVDRNKKQRGVDWQFTAEDARAKLKRLYPIINI